MTKKSLTGVWQGHASFVYSSDPAVRVESKTNVTLVQVGTSLMGRIDGQAHYSDMFCVFMGDPINRTDDDSDPVDGSVTGGRVIINVNPSSPKAASVQFNGVVSTDGDRINGIVQFSNIPSFFGGPFHLIRRIDPPPAEQESVPRVASLALA